MNLLNRFEINEEDSVMTAIGKGTVIGAVTSVAATALACASIVAIVGGALFVDQTIKKIKKNPENE